MALAADGDERFVVVKARKVITVSGEEIRGGTIVIVDGKIRSVGRDLKYPRNSRIIDATDRVVMPGLINPHSRFGLPGYTRGGVHTDLSVSDEYFPRPGHYDDLLDAGYTALALTPAGGGISGRAMVVRTAGPDEQRTLLGEGYIEVSSDKRTLYDALKKAKEEIDKVEKARKEFEEKQKKAAEEAAKNDKGKEKPASQPTSAPASQPAFTPPEIAKPYQPLVDLIQKKEGVSAMIELGRASDFLHMAEVLKPYEVAHQFLVVNNYQTDFYRVAESLGEDKSRVVMRPWLSRMPYSAERLHVVRELSDAGCEVSVVPLNDSATEHGRVLPRLADLVRSGWTRKAALASVTLNPARLLGLDERIGSIEQGRDADLIFLDRDPLNPLARVRAVMIAGEIVHEVEE